MDAINALLDHPLFLDKHALSFTAFQDAPGTLFVCNRESLCHFTAMNLPLIYDKTKQMIIAESNYFVINVVIKKPSAAPIKSSERDKFIHRDTTLYEMYPFISTSPLMPKTVCVHYLAIPNDMCGGELKIYNSFPDITKNVDNIVPKTGMQLSFAGDVFHSIADFTSNHKYRNGWRVSLVVENYCLPSEMIECLPTFAHRHATTYDIRYQRFHHTNALNDVCEQKNYDNGITVYESVFTDEFGKHIALKSNTEKQSHFLISNAQTCWRQEDTLLLTCLQNGLRQYLSYIKTIFGYKNLTFQDDIGFHVIRYTNENDFIQCCNKQLEGATGKSVLCIWTLNDTQMCVQFFGKSQTLHVPRYSLLIIPTCWALRFADSHIHKLFEGAMIWTIGHFHELI